MTKSECQNIINWITTNDNEARNAPNYIFIWINCHKLNRLPVYPTFLIFIPKNANKEYHALYFQKLMLKWSYYTIYELKKAGYVVC